MSFKPNWYPVYFKMKNSAVNEKTWMEDIWIVFFVWLTRFKSGTDLSNKADIRNSYKTLFNQTKINLIILEF